MMTMMMMLLICADVNDELLLNTNPTMPDRNANNADDVVVDDDVDKEKPDNDEKQC